MEELLDSLFQQRENLKARLEAVTRELLSANAVETVKLEDRRKTLVTKLDLINKEIQLTKDSSLHQVHQELHLPQRHLDQMSLPPIIVPPKNIVGRDLFLLSSRRGGHIPHCHERGPRALRQAGPQCPLSSISRSL